MTEHPPASPSPLWSENTKLVVALTLVVIIGALLVKFQFILSPLLISLLLAYLLHPLAEFLRKKTRLSWEFSVGIIFTLFVVVMLGLLTLGGVSLAQQGQSVLNVIKEGIDRLPEFVAEYANRKYNILNFEFDASTLDLGFISQQATQMVEPILSQTGTLFASFAGGAANFFGWTLFVIFVSYFVVVESGGARSKIITVDIPGYSEDVVRLMRKLSRIWNAFLRGQIIIFIMTIIVYVVVLELLGVSYAITLAFIAGLARFLPYVGPAINWVILALVAYFQEHHLFGLSPFAYAALVLLITIVIDMVIDYMITPRIYSNTLKIHPAAVLVAAIVAATLFGVLGVIVAAPILATAALLWQYTINKLLDRDPWQKEEQPTPLPPISASIRGFFSKLESKFKKTKTHPKEKPNEQQ